MVDHGTCRVAHSFQLREVDAPPAHPVSSFAYANFARNPAWTL
jgi:hypothetical protein